MSETPEPIPGAGDGDPGDHAGDGDKQPRTVYMVLWAKIPDEHDEPLRFREIGYYRGHGGDHAKRIAAKDEENGQLGQITDAAKSNGVILRAVPKQSWPEEVEPSKVESKPTLVIR